MFMALDGVVGPGAGNWRFPYFNDEMGRAGERTRDADVLRRTASSPKRRQGGSWRC